VDIEAKGRGREAGSARRRLGARAARRGALARENAGMHADWPCSNTFFSQKSNKSAQSNE
jgi:hypothetical protein